MWICQLLDNCYFTYFLYLKDEVGEQSGSILSDEKQQFDDSGLGIENLLVCIVF